MTSRKTEQKKTWTRVLALAVAGIMVISVLLAALLRM